MSSTVSWRNAAIAGLGMLLYAFTTMPAQAGDAPPQPPVSASQAVSFMVNDDTHIPIPGAVVTVTDVVSKAELKLATSPNGVAVFSNLTPGRYRWLAEMQGFTQRKGRFRIIDKPLQVDVELDLPYRPPGY